MSKIIDVFKDCFDICNNRYLDDIKTNFLNNSDNSNEIKKIINSISYDSVITSLFLKNRYIRELLGVKDFLIIINGMEYNSYYSSKYNIVFLRTTQIDEIEELIRNKDYADSYSDVIEFDDKYKEYRSIIDNAEKVSFVSIKEKFKGKYAISLMNFLTKYNLITTDEVVQFEILYNDFKKDRSKIKNDLSYYIKNDDDFKHKLCSKIFSSISNNYSKEEIEFVISYIISSEYSISLLRFLYTYNFTNNLLDENKSNYNFLDKTFVVVSIFKMVEFLFCKLINKKWPKKFIYCKTSRNKNKINLKKDNLMLAEMEQIFVTDDSEISMFIKIREKYSIPLKGLISRFRKVSRNGFLHKDTIKKNKQLDISIKDSLNSIALLILFFEYPSKS